MEAHACNPSTLGGQVGVEYLRLVVQDQPENMVKKKKVCMFMPVAIGIDGYGLRSPLLHSAKLKNFPEETVM